MAARQAVHVVAEHQVVLGVAVGHVVPGAGHDHVAAGTAEDDVVVAVLQLPRLDEQDRGQGGGLDLLQQRQRQVGIDHVLDDGAVVAEDHVVVVFLGPAGHRAGSLAVEQVAAGVESVGHR